MHQKNKKQKVFSKKGELGKSRKRIVLERNILGRDTLGRDILGKDILESVILRHIVLIHVVLEEEIFLRNNRDTRLHYNATQSFRIINIA